MMFLVGFQPITAGFFTAIGKAVKGAFVALTRQVILLIPLIVILPIFFGIDGIMYSAPVADLAAAILAIALVIREMKNMPVTESEKLRRIAEDKEE